MAKADSAIRSVKSVSYKVVHYTIGTIEYGGNTTLLPPAHGEVKIVHLDDDDAFGAKVAVKGETVSTRKQVENTTFEIVYDGLRIRMFDKKKQIVYSNAPDKVGKMMFIHANPLILWLFTSNEKLEKEFSADSISYAGVAMIGGI